MRMCCKLSPAFDHGRRRCAHQLRRLTGSERNRLRAVPGGRPLALVLISLCSFCSCLRTGQTGELPATNTEARQRYFDGLRERNLYSLAETVCLTELTGRDLTLADRTELVIELSRTFAAHAASITAFDEQAELLQRARLVIDELLAESALHPQRVVLEAQSAFVAASEVELLRWQYELSPRKSDVRDRGLQLSGGLLETFDDLLVRMTRELRNRPRRSDTERLSPYRMRGLKRVTEYRLGMLLLDRARLFAPASPDQAELLLAAQTRFRDLAGGDHHDPVTLQSQLGLIAATRLNGDTAAARRLCDAFIEDDPPAVYLREATAELAETLLTDGAVTEAAAVLRDSRRDPRSASGRLLCLNVQVLLRLAAVAEEKGETDLGAELRSEARSFAAQTGLEAPGYWAHRARRLVETDELVAQYGLQAAPHIQQGRSEYGAGQIRQAIDSYRTGWNLLRDSERTEQAIEIGYALGSLLVNEEQYREAESVLAQVTADAADHPRRAQADFLRLFALARLYRQQPTRSRRETYTQALENHREQYRNAESFADATWMLARLQEVRRQTTAALRLYTEIPEQHALHTQALVGIARCGQTILARLKRLGRDRSDWQSAILSELAPDVRTLTDSDDPVTPVERELLMRTATLLMTLDEPDFQSADRLLDRVLQSETASSGTGGETVTPPTAAPQDTGTFHNDALALKVVSLAGTGRSLDARLQLDQVGSTRPESLAVILQLLGDISTDSLAPDTKAVLGALQVRTMELSSVDLDAMPVDEQIPLRLALTDAHEQTGHPAAAARELAVVAAARPDDLSLHRRLAVLQLRSDEPELIRQSREIWRRLESQARAGSDAWMDARRHVIECSLALGESEEAAKLLKITTLLYPNKGTPETREALASLAAEQQSR